MSNATKPECKYGAKCYRTNSEHFDQFQHPDKAVPTYNLRSPRRDAKRSASPKSPNKNTKQQTEVIDSSATKKVKKTSIKDYFNRASTTSATITNSKAMSKTPEPAEIEIPPYEIPEIAISDTSKSESLQEYFSSLQRRDYIAAKKEYEDLLKQPDKFIRQHFLVKMPDDFYHFWVWCTENVKENEIPEELFADFNLEMVGPFDVLTGKFNESKQFEPSEYLRHYRYFYDPPEFQTIFIKKDTDIHYGYWRDDPNAEEQYFIARNDQSQGCHIQIIASDIFAAVLYFLRKDSSNFDEEKHSQLVKDLEALSKKYGKFEELQKKRRTVCKLFHRAGLAVPYDRKSDVGYRPLPEGEAVLRKMLQNLDISPDSVIENLQPMITSANIAVDEGDFGASLELGIDLFCHGKTNLHPIVLQLLINGYMMVKRPQYIAIIKSHLEDRKRSDVNILMRKKN